MLLLANRFAGLQICDLRPKEREYVLNTAKEFTQYATVLRDGFMSTVAYRYISFGRGKEKHAVLFAKEVHRWIAKTDEHYVCDYLSQPFMYNDWSVIFCMKDLRRRRWWRTAEPPRNGLKPWGKVKSGRFQRLPIGKELFGYEELMQFMRENVHKYFYIQPEAYHDFAARFYAWDFAWHYLKALPISEIFCKIGYPCFMQSKGIRKLDKKDMKRFGRWLIQNGPSITSAHGLCATYPFEDIIYCFNHNITKEQNEKRKIENYTMQKLGKTKEEAKDLLRYLIKQPYCKYYSEITQSVVNHYADYLKQCAISGLKVNERGVQFPRDFDDRLCKLQAEERRKENKKKNDAFNAKLREVPKKLGLSEVFQSKNGFDFVIATQISQFNELGNKLHQCVGSCGYKEKVVKRESLIIGVYKEGKPINCVELKIPTEKNPSYSVLQNYGDHNRPSQYQDEITKDLSTYIAMANRQWRNINGIA